MTVANHMTGRQVLNDAVMRALGWPTNTLDNDVVLQAFAIARLNSRGKQLWDMRIWDNEKIDRFMVQPDSKGIIVFDPTVDIIRAMRKVNVTNGNATALDPFVYPDGYPVFSQDETVSNLTSDQLATDYWEIMADDPATGARRVRFNIADPQQSYMVIAVLRFVPFTADNYAANSWLIDRANAALIGYISDDLRTWQQLPPTKDGAEALKVALDRDMHQQNREIRGMPRYPAFAEAGRW